VTKRSEHFAFVLFHPRSAGNVGAAARALKNMGFADLRIVATRKPGGAAALKMAVHGREVLEAATIFPDLKSAVADCTLTVGTTAREGPYRSAAQPPREAAAELTALAPPNRIALIFGPEDFGLTNRELKLCQRLIAIPAAPDYRSLNLAQALLIVAYELRLACVAAEHPAQPATSPMLAAAAEEVDAMFERMARALVRIGFLPADNPEHIMFGIREIFGRTRLAPREVDILNGIARQIAWFARGGRETVAAKRRAGKKVR
jgi:tRNA/rRNA methyltransferase